MALTSKQVVDRLKQKSEGIGELAQTISYENTDSRDILQVKRILIELATDVSYLFKIVAEHIERGETK